MAAQDAGRTRVYLEVAKRRTFAMAVDWPGWGRAGKTPDDALAALGAYAARYAKVAKRATVAFRAAAGSSLEVIEELPGNATTEFGAPAVLASVDTHPSRAGEAERMAALLKASWQEFDAIVAKAPAELRKGPRGGGRDRDKIVDHVLGAESAYARKIGIRVPAPESGDRVAIEAMRTAVLAVIGAPSDGSPPVPKGWPVRYAARRFAWHVLDHAWEIEDRQEARG